MMNNIVREEDEDMISERGEEEKRERPNKPYFTKMKQMNGEEKLMGKKNLDFWYRRTAFRQFGEYYKAMFNSNANIKKVSKHLKKLTGQMAQKVFGNVLSHLSTYNDNTGKLTSDFHKHLITVVHSHR